MKYLEAGADHGIQPTLDVEEYSTYNTSRPGAIPIPTYIISTTTGLWYSNLESGGGHKFSPVFNDKAPFVGNGAVVSGDPNCPYLFVAHRTSTTTCVLKIYKMALGDIRAGKFNPECTPVWRLNWYKSRPINAYFYVVVNYYPLMGEGVFFIYGLEESLLIDITTKTVLKRIRFTSNNYRISGYSACVIFSVHGTSAYTRALYFLDLNGKSSTPSYLTTYTAPGSMDRGAADFAPYSEGFVRQYMKPETQPHTVLAKIVNTVSGVTVVTKIATEWPYKQIISYGGAFSDVRDTTVTDSGETTVGNYKFTKYYRYYRRFSYLGNSSGQHAFSNGLGGSCGMKGDVIMSYQYIEYSQSEGGTTIVEKALIPDLTYIYFVDQDTCPTASDLLGQYNTIGAFGFGMADEEIYHFQMRHGGDELYYLYGSVLRVVNGVGSEIKSDPSVHIYGVFEIGR